MLLRIVATLPCDSRAALVLLGKRLGKEMSMHTTEDDSFFIAYVILFFHLRVVPCVVDSKLFCYVVSDT